MMGRRSAPSKCFAHRAKPWRRANSLCPSIKNWVPRHALRVWDGAASQNLGQRRILIKHIKAPGVLLLLAAPRRGLFLCVLYFASSIKIPEINRFPGFLARQKGIEPPASPLGEPLNICHLCSPMYRKAFIRQAFFVFRVAPCSSKFTGVVRCSPVLFSSFLDFSKKGNKNIFHLPPILAQF